MKKVSTLFMQWGILLFAGVLCAQVQSPLDIALRNLETNYQKYNLLKEDISDVAVSDKVITQSNGMTNIYLVQRYEGIEIYNAIMNFTLSNDGRVIYTGNRFIYNIASRANAKTPQISAAQAITSVLADLGGSLIYVPVLKETRSDKSFVFEKGQISRADIPVKLRYQKMPDGSLKLAWDVVIDYLGGNDYWSIRVDALTGKILEKKSFTVHCQIHNDAYKHNDECSNGKIDIPELISVTQAIEKKNNLLLGNQYNVFSFPLESAGQGPRTIVTDPADLNASPYGWHDTNGTTGAEFTITRGNNVWAFQDKNADYLSMNDEPQGGTNLIFDSPINPVKEPYDNTEAAVTQLFYTMNFMHDFTYKFGFDEYANFQAKNYKSIGLGNDYVNALSQFDANTLANINNADFSTPEDGSNSRVRMFLWDNSVSVDKYLKVNAPFKLKGTYFSTPGAFGATIDFANPVTGDVIISNDGDADNPTFACSDLSNGNGADMAGKIVLIDRGGCEFGFKALNAQNHGAVGVIIVNFEEATISMGSGAVGNQVNIPVLMIKKADGDLLRKEAGAGGLNVTIQGPDNTSTGPQLIDGSFDNGIMAHEFGHGVSTRLTGGPANSGCLGNGEEMGEGWSDFLALVTTVKPWDTKETLRGVGTYVTKEDSLGKGIRTYPYSVNQAINPHTYGSVINNSEVHFVGEVWTAMLWDLFWAMVDKYGLDASYINTESGNYKAVKLVIDAMKIQPCGPGFVDGRDAIIAADEINYGGENSCLIWDVFAKRGLGYFADQGDPDVVGDAKEDFNTLPVCLNRMQIKKECTPLINAGDEISYTLTVSNYKLTPVTNVVVTDKIPAGTTYVSGSASNGGSSNGATVTFNLGTMTSGQTIVLTYKLASSPSKFSVRKFYENCDNLDFWNVGSKIGSDGWNPVTDKSYSPSSSFKVNDVSIENRQDLIFGNTYSDIPADGARPVIRFYQWYNTEPGADGGYVELSEDSTKWVNAKPYFIRNGYPSKLQYATFVLPNVEAFSGNSGGWIASYIDLKDFKGKNLNMMRFRYGSDDNISGVAWYIDDVEYMDMVSYNTEACVTNAEGDNECASAPEEGTIVESQLTSTKDLQKGDMAVYPNPASNYITVSLNSISQGNYDLDIISLDGRLMKKTKINLLNGENSQSVDVSRIPSGCYIIKIQTDKVYYVNKIILTN